VFIGHFAVALGAKRSAPKVSLGWLFLSCQLADLIWPVLVIAGVERFAIVPGTTPFTRLQFIQFPWSHGLLPLLAWSLLLALAYLAWHRDDRRGAVVVGLVALSHWVLDWVSHLPDMPLYPGGSQHLGLGLWRSTAGTVIVETLLFVVGAWLYARATRPRDRAGRIGFMMLVIILLGFDAASIMGPPPPSVNAVTYSAFGVWLLVLLAWWVDRHRAAGPLRHRSGDT